MANRTSGKPPAAATKRRVPAYLHALWIILALGVVLIGGRVWNLERRVQQAAVDIEKVVAISNNVAASGQPQPATDTAVLPEDDVPEAAEDEPVVAAVAPVAATGRTSEAVVTALAAPAIGQGINAPALAGVDTERTLNAPPIKERYYWTRPGDSLWRISRRVYGAGMYYNHIAEANGLDDPTLIQANVLLLIPELK